MAGREEMYPEIRRLREDEGLMWREIAEQLDLARSTVFDYYTHPTLDDDRARRAKYKGTCDVCEAPTSWSSQGTPNHMCVRCANAARRKWTREGIIGAIQAWGDEHGGVPPVATDWNRKRDDHDRWPYLSTVLDVFGTWSKAIRAAGFQPWSVGHYGREGEDPVIVAETIRLYRSGLSCDEVGEAMGVTGSCIRSRLVNAGEPRRSRWTSQAA